MHYFVDYTLTCILRCAVCIIPGYWWNTPEHVTRLFSRSVGYMWWSAWSRWAV